MYRKKDYLDRIKFDIINEFTCKKAIIDLNFDSNFFNNFYNFSFKNEYDAFKYFINYCDNEKLKPNFDELMKSNILKKKIILVNAEISVADEYFLLNDSLKDKKLSKKMIEICDIIICDKNYEFYLENKKKDVLLGNSK